MASVHLNFYPPERPGFVKLYIYEASSADASDPLNLIETVTDIGVYPDYINGYSTDNASLIDDWFAIQFEDSAGAKTDISDRMAGRTATLVGLLVTRVMLSNPDLNENVVGQAAEYVVSIVMRTETPYDPSLPNTVTYRQLEGMTLLTQARAEIRSLIASTSLSGGSFTAGLVSMKSSGSQTGSTDLIDYLQKEASRILNLNPSRVGQICVGEIAGGLSQRRSIDESRLLMIEIQ